VRANAVNSFQDIGFGYVGNAAQHKPPAVIAYEQTSAAGETSGDLVFGTRGTTSGSTAAVEQVRIRSDGTVDVESVRFTGSQIGINGDPNLMVLTSGVVDGGRQGGVDDAGDERGGDGGDDPGRGRRPDAVEKYGSADLAHREWVFVDIERRVRGGGVGAVCW
jgi:hypothetical protein